MLKAKKIKYSVGLLFAAVFLNIMLAPDLQAAYTFPSTFVRPFALSKTVYLFSNSTLPITLNAIDPDAQLSYAIYAKPTNGTLSGIAPNLTYTPNANYIGTDSFEFTAKNADYSSYPATISIVISPSLPIVPVNNLIAYYDMNNNLLDRSGNNKHGEIFDAVSIGGKFGQGFEFGETKYIRINKTNNLNGLSQITISLWFNNKNNIITGSNHLLFFREDATDGAVSYAIRLGSNNAIQSYVNDKLLTSADDFMLNYTDGWHHVVLRHDNSKQELYFDGVKIASVPQASPISDSAKPIIFGNNGNVKSYSNDVNNAANSENMPTAYGGQFNGHIDDVAIFDRALSDSEIEAIYNSGRSISGEISNGGTSDTTPPAAPTNLTVQ